MFDNPRNVESQCSDCFSFKEFSVLKCLKTIKIIFISPELIALPLIAVGLLDTGDFITFILFFCCLKTYFMAFPF